MTEMLLRPLADAFMQVGVFVAVLIAGFGWLRCTHGDRLLAMLQRPRWAPPIGALLGVVPGCAGAILVVPLYARGSVSFGGVIAALVATMGDSSWVIMAADPEAALTVHAILLGTGMLTGYAVDALGIIPTLRRPTAATAVGPATDDAGASGPTTRHAGFAGSAPAAPAASAAALDRSAAAATTTAVAVVPDVIAASFWVLVGAGFIIAVPVAFQLLDPTALSGALAGLDLYLVLGSAGTLTATAIFIAGRGRTADDTAGTAWAATSERPFTALVRQGGRETSFVIVCVAAAYVAWATLHTTTGFDGTQLPLAGLVGVLVGATVGLIPGCAVQIVLTGLYVSGAVPFSTLIANALSQDGDALLPLLALESRSALVATCITTLPGLLVGGLSLLVI